MNLKLKKKKKAVRLSFRTCGEVHFNSIVIIGQHCVSHSTDKKFNPHMLPKSIPGTMHRQPAGTSAQ